MRWVYAWTLWQGVATISTSASLSFEVREVVSPNGLMTARLWLNADGGLRYDLSFDGEKVIMESALGLQSADPRAEHRDIPEGTNSLYDHWSQWSSTEDAQLHHEQWDPILGEESGPIRIGYNELVVQLGGAEDGGLNVRFRVYDIGLAFRYEFEGAGVVRIAHELTEFVLTGDHDAWWSPGDYDATHHEYYASTLSEIRYHTATMQSIFSLTGVQTPLQLKSENGLYINIHEASLVDFPAMHLELTESNWKFTAHLTPGLAGIAAVLHRPAHSPWRTVMVTRDPREILKSRLIYALNEPCALKDVSWIRPMKYVGIWWEMVTGRSRWDYTNEPITLDTNYTTLSPHGLHGATTARVRQYIEFASKHGFDAVLAEGWNVGWESWPNAPSEQMLEFAQPYPDFDVEALSRFGADRGIQLMMHHNPISGEGYEHQLNNAYDFMRTYKSTIVKTDYSGIFRRGSAPVHHRLSQVMIRQYINALRTAVKYNIHLNMRNALKSTGLSRTYPNLLTVTNDMYPDALQATILPFTQAIGGPIDLGAGILEMNTQRWVQTKGFNPTQYFSDSSSNSGEEGRRPKATIVQQIALYVALYSPLQMAADLPEHYAIHESRAFQFIKDVPLVWEKNIYLEAEPGSHVVVARKDKASDDWYIGGVAGPSGFDFELAYNFLDGNQYYQGVVYVDDRTAHYLTNPQAYHVTSQVVRKDSATRVHIAPGGGYAAKLTKITSSTTGCPKPAIRRRSP